MSWPTALPSVSSSPVRGDESALLLLHSCSVMHMLMINSQYAVRPCECPSMSASINSATLLEPSTTERGFDSGQPLCTTHAAPLAVHMLHKLLVKGFL